MKLTHRLLIALGLFLSIPVDAQPLQNGATYVLRGTSGRYLSAYENPLGALGLAPHASGWEQWRYMDAGNGLRYLISYHGTMLAIAPATGAVSHVPRFAKVDQPGFALQTYESKLADDGSSVGVAVTTNPLESHGVMITRVGPNGVWILGDTINGLVSRLQRTAVVASQKVPVSNFDEWWGIYPVPSPDMNRKPVQEAMVTGHYLVESAHRARMCQGAPVVTTSSADPETMTVIQSAQTKHTVLFIRENDQTENNAPSTYIWNSEYLIGYGDRLCIELGKNTDYKNVFRRWFLQPGTKTAGQFNLPTAIAGLHQCSAWTIVDPTGRHRNGDRIGSGDKVAIRNVGNGKQLSAEPGLPQLVLSPNTAAWELWTLTRSPYYAGY